MKFEKSGESRFLDKKKNTAKTALPCYNSALSSLAAIIPFCFPRLSIKYLFRREKHVPRIKKSQASRKQSWCRTCELSFNIQRTNVIKISNSRRISDRLGECHSLVRAIPAFFSPFLPSSLSPPRVVSR